MFVLKYNVRCTTLGWRHNCNFPDSHILPDMGAGNKTPVLYKSHRHSSLLSLPEAPTTNLNYVNHMVGGDRCLHTEEQESEAQEGSSFS